MSSKERSEIQDFFMIYLFVTFGFIAGFVAGQMLLLRMTRSYTKQELLENKSLHTKYGLLNWLIAFVGAFMAWQAYQYFFFN